MFEGLSSTTKAYYKPFCVNEEMHDNVVDVSGNTPAHVPHKNKAWKTSSATVWGVCVCGGGFSTAL